MFKVIHSVHLGKMKYEMFTNSPKATYLKTIFA